MVIAAVVLVLAVAAACDLMLLGLVFGALEGPLGGWPLAAQDCVEGVVVLLLIALALAVGADAQRLRRSGVVWGVLALVLPGIGAIAWIAVRLRHASDHKLA